jgi:hypothetical protein
LIVVLTENDFRHYRGKQQDFLAIVNLKGGDWQTARLATGDFKTVDGQQSLKSWENVDDLGFRAYHDPGGKVRLGSDRWNGPQPSFRNLRWEEVHRE